MKKIWLIMMVSILVLTGCGTNSHSEEETSNQTNNGVINPKITITTTIFPLYDMLSSIVNEDILVQLILPENADFHSYELTTQDFKTISESDYFFYISDTSEPFVKKFINSGDYETNFIEISDVETLKTKIESELYNQHGDLIDPHIWLSPKKSILILEAIESSLDSIAIEKDSIIDREKKQKYNVKLLEINDIYANFGKINNKKIVVNHDGYKYLELDYGIITYPIFGGDHHAEPSLTEINEIIKYVKSNDISNVYNEYNNNETSIIENIASQSGVEVLMLDNMTSSRESKNYYDRLVENIENMKRV